MSQQSTAAKKDSLTVVIVRLFTTSHLSLLFLLISLFAGAAALSLTPREEDPQIIVPVMDVFINFPGTTSEEVEKLVSAPLESLLKQIQGIEYVYFASRPGEAVVTVRYEVGHSLEDSLIKTRDKLQANLDIIPPGVTGWVVKPVEIDDVPIVMMTLSMPQIDEDIMAISRIAEELLERLRVIDDIGKSRVIGAAPRQISVYPDPPRLKASGVSFLELQQALLQNNVNLQAGQFTQDNREIILEAGPHYQSIEQLGATVLKTADGRIVYLRDVAEIINGAQDTAYYTRIGFGPTLADMQRIGGKQSPLPQVGEELQMAIIAIAKRRGSNAVSVAEQVLELTEQLQGTLIQDGVLITVTRNYGKTADHKVNELVMHLSIAILTIIVLLALSLGFKEALIVSLAVPMTFAITLLCDLLFGYTINRVTLFALILSLGLLVDDPIVDVENIHRHYKMRKEATDEVAAALGRYLSTINEVSSYQSYIGLASPMDLNGMVRHYYLRQGGYVGDIRVLLIEKTKRKQQSHAIALRIRPEIDHIEKQYGANIKIVEMPPGPPVLSIVVAEIYGPPEADYNDLIKVANRVRTDLEQIEGVVDVDDYVEAPHQRLRYRLKQDKAALLGISSQQVANNLKLAVEGGMANTLHISSERQPLLIEIQLPRSARSSEANLLNLLVKTAQGQLVHLDEIGHFIQDNGDQTIYHKNLRPVAYILGEMAGRSPVETVWDMFDVIDEHPLPKGYSAEMAGEGEWKITVDVFRDLGLAFGAAMVMIYILLVGQTGSLGVPLIMMITIPLTVIGIMPGFWFINLFAEDVGAYADPVYFTATAMIGMIALAGIVVRNSIILIDFIEKIYRSNPDISLADAIIEAGATRMNPIFLTAASAVLGSVMIVLDPIFSGLAWSFIFGIIASTLFSLVVIPLVYFLINRDMKKETKEVQ